MDMDPPGPFMNMDPPGPFDMDPPGPFMDDTHADDWMFMGSGSEERFEGDMVLTDEQLRQLDRVSLFLPIQA